MENPCLLYTSESLYKGIQQAVPGNRIGDIGHAVQSYCEERGFSVVRDFVGHGAVYYTHLKIVLNVGCGEASDNSKVVDAIINDLSIITGQKPVVRCV